MTTRFTQGLWLQATQLVITVISALTISILPANASDNRAFSVYAAASLTDVIDDAIQVYNKSMGTNGIGVYASSAAIARQIENGAPADLFISANDAWMIRLEEGEHVISMTKKILARNRLVVIASNLSTLPDNLNNPLSLRAAMSGNRMAIGDPRTVPAGIYAAQVLDYFQMRDVLEPNLIYADNVRAALSWVERREIDLGIVYATDAALSKKVKILGTLSTITHKEINYPVALTQQHEGEHAQNFLDFLCSPQGQDIFTHFGFLPSNSQS